MQCQWRRKVLLYYITHISELVGRTGNGILSAVRCWPENCMWRKSWSINWNLDEQKTEKSILVSHTLNKVIPIEHIHAKMNRKTVDILERRDVVGNHESSITTDLFQSTGFVFCELLFSVFGTPFSINDSRQAWVVPPARHEPRDAHAAYLNVGYCPNRTVPLQCCISNAAYCVRSSGELMWTMHTLTDVQSSLYRHSTHIHCTIHRRNCLLIFANVRHRCQQFRSVRQAGAQMADTNSGQPGRV